MAVRRLLAPDGTNMRRLLMKYYRTMQEAFGPYVSRDLTPMDDDAPSVSEVLVLVLIVLVSALSALILVLLS